MTDLSLNKKLGGVIRYVSQIWGHDSTGETIATILDVQINNWVVSPPPIPTELPEQATKVRLRRRHQEYFERLAEYTGESTANTARASIIQWLISPNNATATPTKPSLPPNLPTVTRKLSKGKPKNPNNKPRQPNSSADKATMQASTPQAQQNIPATSAGRKALSSLL